MRPHQHLRRATPGARYRPFLRPYPSVLPAITYPSHFTEEQVSAAGRFRLGPQLYFLSYSLCHNPVGLEEVDDGLWSEYFCHLLLARIDLRTATLTRG